MLCEICQKRPANVYETHCYPTHQVQRRLCEVCAGVKTEEQFGQERAIAQQRKRELLLRACRVLAEEFVRPNVETIRTKQVQIRNRSFFDPVILITVNSDLPDVDPVELLIGPVGKGKKHVLRQVQGFDVHVVRWDADPERLLSNLFEPFPNAGAVLNHEERTLSVAREDTLFPEAQKSYAFCNVAAWQFNIDGQPGRNSYQLRPRSVTGPWPPRSSDQL